MKYKLAILVTFLSLVTGCSTYNVASYGTSVQNVETLKSYNLQHMSVGTFQVSETLEFKRKPGNQKKPATASVQCRGAGPVTASPSFEAYIEQAFIEELKLAGIYDASSSLVLTGKFEQLDFSSAFGNSRWTFTLTLTNARNESFTTQTTFGFPSRYLAEVACAGVAQAFAPAVQQLITDVIKNPKFREIAN
ncbi:MAG: hypothetical protein LBQ75_01955 [Zoogloeaceae bacterium]|nr:hypothetical protein [Zoogloeaceae bacterium]